MTEGITVEYTPARGTRQRVRFEPRVDGPGYWRIDEVWNGCRWRIQGREPSGRSCATTRSDSYPTDFRFYQGVG